MLPGRNRPQASRDSDPEPVADVPTLSKLTRIGNHRSDRQIVRSGSRLWAVTVDEEELPYSIRRGGQ